MMALEQGSGENAKDRFRSLLGASKDHAPIVTTADGRCAIEVREADANTINQVRAIRFRPLVVYAPTDEQWYVVPPTSVAKLVAAKERGQHGTIAFENSTLSRDALDEFRVSEDDLVEAVNAAVHQALDHAEPVSGIMSSLQRELDSLAEEYRQQVADATD